MCKKGIKMEYNEEFKTTDKKRLTPGQKRGYGMMICGLAMIFGAILGDRHHRKVMRVNEQVEEYEKTLPPKYMEYKQAVEHYRDSLMRVKGL